MCLGPRPEPVRSHCADGAYYVALILLSLIPSAALVAFASRGQVRVPGRVPFLSPCPAHDQARGPSTSELLFHPSLAFGSFP